MIKWHVWQHMPIYIFILLFMYDLLLYYLLHVLYFSTTAPAPPSIMEKACSISMSTKWVQQLLKTKTTHFVELLVTGSFICHISFISWAFAVVPLLPLLSKNTDTAGSKSQNQLLRRVLPPHHSVDEHGCE